MAIALEKRMIIKSMKRECTECGMRVWKKDREGGYDKGSETGVWKQVFGNRGVESGMWKQWCRIRDVETGVLKQGVNKRWNQVVETGMSLLHCIRRV